MEEAGSATVRRPITPPVHHSKIPHDHSLTSYLFEALEALHEFHGEKRAAAAPLITR